MAFRLCNYCHRPFFTTKHAQHFCRPSCQNSSRILTQGSAATRPCDHCRRPYIPVRQAQRFCRPRCREVYHNLAKTESKTAERLALARRVREAAIRQEPSYRDDPFWDA